MFDSIGRSTDTDARRRYALSLLLTAGIYGAGAGLLAGLLTSQAPQLAQAEPPVELTFIDELPEEELKPPEPPSGGRSDERQTATPEQPPAQTETEPDDPVLKPLVETSIAPSTPQGPPGTGEAPGSGTEGTGTGAGLGCSGPDCGGGTGATVHRLTLTARKRVEPTYPEAAKALGLGDQRCVAQVFVDEDGVPYQVDITGCPAAFHQATRTALLGWRFYPPKLGKQRVKGQMTIGITYKLER